ncbi:GtrA family protein, partial [Tetragenococcus muriaticus]
WSLVVSNTLSWIFSVLFAFATNKKWVFKSKTRSVRHFFEELSKFFFYRIVSFGIDMGCMLLFINSFHMDDFWAKLITQIIIVIANYVFSKFLIFTKKTTDF